MFSTMKTYLYAAIGAVLIIVIIWVSLALHNRQTKIDTLTAELKLAQTTAALDKANEVNSHNVATEEVLAKAGELVTSVMANEQDKAVSLASSLPILQVKVKNAPASKCNAAKSSAAADGLRELQLSSANSPD